MLIAVGLIAALLPFILLAMRHFKTSTPSLQWPGLAGILKFQYQDKPPRLFGQWEGRNVTIELHNERVLVTMQLAQPSRLRVEVGPKEEVARRAGMIVPDPVLTRDPAFEDRLLARCSDKSVGPSIFDPTLRQRLMSLPFVEALGVSDKVQWMLPELSQAEGLERVLEVMTAIASELESFPVNA